MGGTVAQSIKHLPLGHKDLSPHTKAGHGVGICNPSAGRVDPLSWVSADKVGSGRGRLLTSPSSTCSHWIISGHVLHFALLLLCSVAGSCCVARLASNSPSSRLPLQELESFLGLAVPHPAAVGMVLPGCQVFTFPGSSHLQPLRGVRTGFRTGTWGQEVMQSPGTLIAFHGFLTQNHQPRGGTTTVGKVLPYSRKCSRSLPKDQSGGDISQLRLSLPKCFWLISSLHKASQYSLMLFYFSIENR